MTKSNKKENFEKVLKKDWNNFFENNASPSAIKFSLINSI